MLEIETICQNNDDFSQCQESIQINKQTKPWKLDNPKTSLEMDGKLTLIFANFVTTQDIITKISAYLEGSFEIDSHQILRAWLKK